jgi:hypothetical protein
VLHAGDSLGFGAEVAGAVFMVLLEAEPHPVRAVAATRTQSDTTQNEKRLFTRAMPYSIPGQGWCALAQTLAAADS